MDSVAHFEIPVDDFDRAKKFYSSAFAWKLDSVPDMGYVMCYTAEADEKHLPKNKCWAINGGMFKRTKELKNPVITIMVEDISKSLEKIKKSGGKIIKNKFNVGDMGISAYFQDTEGNIIGIWQNLK